MLCEPFKSLKKEGQSSRYLRDHVFEGFHDLGTFSLLRIGETASYDDYGREYHTEVQLEGNRQDC